MSPLFPPQAYRKTEFTHRIGLSTDRPNAADVLVGTLWFSTDTLVLERSNGITWDSYFQPNNSSSGVSFPYFPEIEEPELPYIIPGPQGIQGITGATGATGIGPPGIDGNDGDYELIVPPTNQIITPASFTFTTTGNIDDLDFANAPLIRANNASDATIRGLKAGYDGQRVTIVSVGAGNLYTANQNANSSATNRLINFATSSNTPLAAGVGSCFYQYDVTTGRWRLVAHEQGAWITPTFAAGDFGTNGSAMTWTVDAADRSGMGYRLSGKTLQVYMEVTTSSIGGVPSGLLSIANTQYGSFVWAAASPNVSAPVIISDNGIYFSGRWTYAAGASQVLGQKSDASVWTVSVNNTAIFGTLIGFVD